MGESDRPEAVQALVERLDDRGFVETPNGSLDDRVGSWAEEALRNIEKKTGRILSRIPPER